MTKLLLKIIKDVTKQMQGFKRTCNELSTILRPWSKLRKVRKEEENNSVVSEIMDCKLLLVFTKNDSCGSGTSFRYILGLGYLQ